MARLPRLTLADHPHHIIQRGNNRQPIVVDDEDCRVLIALLGDSARKHQVAIHAYVLMSNHFHLLATPSTQDGIPKTMQALGRAYVRYFNRRHARTGTLWEGRYRSTLIQSERFLLTCMAYIDLNPVRAGVAAGPESYPWSSHDHYAGRRVDKVVTPHPLYWALGNTPFAREAAYAQLVHGGLRGTELQALTEATLHGWALGDAGFVADLQCKTDRRLTQARAGRPRKRSIEGQIQSVPNSDAMRAPEKQ